MANMVGNIIILIFLIALALITIVLVMQDKFMENYDNVSVMGGADPTSIDGVSNIPSLDPSTIESADADTSTGPLTGVDVSIRYPRYPPAPHKYITFYGANVGPNVWKSKIGNLREMRNNVINRDYDGPWLIDPQFYSEDDEVPGCV